MRSLSLPVTLEKHKLASDQPWFMLLDIIFNADTDTPTYIRIARNTEDVTFQGNVYQAFNFEPDVSEDNGKGELPTVSIRVSNVNRAIHGYLEQYSGGVGAKVILYLVNKANMNGEPELQADFEVIDAHADVMWVTFTLGGDSPMRQMFPRFYYLQNYCIWTYNTPAMQAGLDPRGLQCGYKGNLTTCSKTLDGANGCRAHNNSGRFGGFTTIDTNGFRAAQLQ
jgi:lambda family phage minor tail protein L